MIMASTSRVNRKIITGLLLVLLLTLSAGCGGGECQPGFSVTSPSSSNVEIIEGKIRNFSFNLRSCSGKISKINWNLDDKPYAEDLTMVTIEGCPDLEGQHSLKLVVRTTKTTISKSWKINIVNKADPDKPECYGKALDTVQSGIIGVSSSESPTGMNMSDAYQCFEEYLKKSPCNLEANMAAGIAHLSLTLANAPMHLALAFSASNNGVESFIQSEIDPLITYFGTVAEHGNSRFTFPVNNLLINIPIADLTFNLSGEWGVEEAKTLTSLLTTLKGLLYTGLAYNGFYELPLIMIGKNPEKSLISRIKIDETFLMLTGKNGEKGKEYLTKAQQLLVQGLTEMVDAILSVESEPDPVNHVIKYWDCGKDAVCPPKYSDYPDGDPAEPYEDSNHNGRYDQGEKYEDLNGNGRWNDSWENIGPDEGEDDGQYTDGEPIGTDIIAGHRIRFSAGTRLINIITTVRDNIKGPDPLNLDKFFGVPEGTMRKQFNQFGIPYPEIRLSEFYVTPSNLRNMLPLYSISKEKFFNQPEMEPYKDWGVDQLKDEDEPYYDPATNPDPDHDDYDLQTNMNDGYDNDGDGYIDERDPNGDYGLEGNQKYDYLDTAPTNGKQDIGEKCEPFYDVGITTPNGIYGKDNGVWDELDTDHAWPKGDDVGGPEVNIDIDPKDGTTKDKDQRLIDEFYLFFPDATFSGVLTFPDPTVNVDGKTLTRNAELFRFIGKMKENAYYFFGY